MKKIWLLVFVLFFSIGLSNAYAAENTSKLNIQLQLDNGTVSINGVESKGEAPYLSNETTLVPMRIITTAFGATLKWDGDTQSITLKYGDKTIKLTIGSLDAEVNGKSAQLPAAPELKNDSTMVPIRFISETFGANVQYDDATGKITITGEKLAGNAGTDINIDAGKTRIGNSYYGWSMKYPTDLIKEDMSSKEDLVMFTQADGEYTLFVSTFKTDNSHSGDNLLQLLSDSLQNKNETILDKKTVTDAGITYATMTTRDDDKGYYYEDRLYQSGENEYYLSLGAKETIFKNTEKKQAFEDLLNSFKPSFDGGTDIKDLSTVQDGSRPYNNTDFGFKVSLPADWNVNEGSLYRQFVSEDDSMTLYIRMTSIAANDTVEKWVNRDAAYMKSDFVPEALKSSDPVPASVGGENGYLWKYSYKLGDSWSTVYGYYVFKGNYKYEIDFNFNNGLDKPEQVDKILKTFELTGNVNSSYGTLADDRDFVDKTKVHELKYKADNFAVSIPDYWHRLDVSDGIYAFSGNSAKGSYVVFEGSLDNFKRNMDNELKSKESNVDGFKLISGSTQVQIAGASGYKWVYSTKNSGGTETITTVYAVAKDGKLYIFNLQLYSATNTESNQKVLDSIIQSFRFLN